MTACSSVPEPSVGFEHSIRPVEQIIDSDIEIVLLLQRAQAAYDAKRYEESFENYQIAALKAPQNLTAHIGWGNAALALRLNEKAYEIFSNTQAIETASQRQQAQYLAGLVLSEVATNRSEDAEVRLNAALEDNLDDTRLWNALGRYHDSQKNWVNAERTYLKALISDASAQPIVTNNIGISLLKQGRFDLALKKFEKAHALESERDLYDNNRRLTLALMRHYKQATQDISEDRAASIFNDAGYIAFTHEKYAIAQSLLEQSIETSASYNLEATQNLEQLKTKLQSLNVTTELEYGQKNSSPDWGQLLP